MKLARATHFDESDMRVYASPARTGEWAISGGFEFSDWSEGDLVGKAKQAFSNGWLGVQLPTNSKLPRSQNFKHAKKRY